MGKYNDIKEVMFNLNQKYENWLDFSEYEYIGRCVKSKIRCVRHDYEFLSNYDSLIRDRVGCPHCRKNKLSYTTEEYILACINKHGSKYDYSNVKYCGSKSKINVLCKTHGEFAINAYKHLNGSGCIKCRNEYQMLSLDDFIIKSKSIHGDKYDYSLVKYKGSKVKVDIICKEHGKFSQIPNTHLMGAGCTLCSNKNSSILEREWLDEMRVDVLYRQSFVVINGIKYKVDAYDPTSNTIYEFYGDYWHGNPEVHDQNDINVRNGKTYGELYDNTMRRHNILSENYNLVYIWEKDFLKLKKEKKVGKNFNI